MMIFIILIFIFFVIIYFISRGEKKDIDAEAVFHGRCAPYGYFKVGNPIVKFTLIILITVAVYLRDFNLVVQTAIIILFMIWMPFRYVKYQKASSFIMGLIAMGIAGLSFIKLPFGLSDLTLNIPGYADIDILYAINLLIALIVYFIIAKSDVFATRDFAWIVDLSQNKKLRELLAGNIFSFAYGILRFPEAIQIGSISIKSRGGDYPFSRKGLLSLKENMTNFSLWVLYFIRIIEEMTQIVEYVLVSRVRVRKRKIPIWRDWYSSDYTVSGMIIFCLLVPRILKYLKNVF